MTTGERIYEARKRAGMTQEELADKLDVTRQAVSKWESDTAFPETDKIVELCKLFDLSADELLLGADKKREEEEPAAPEPASAPAAEEPGERKTEEKGRRLHFEYKSKTKIGKLPLVHINVGLGAYSAKGVIAIGNSAKGILAIGFLSMGVLSIGLLTLGLFAFGPLALGLIMGAGAITTGIAAFGGIAVGVFSFGGIAVGYLGVGGLAVGQYAIGGYAHGNLAIGVVGAKGEHAFLMPEQFKELCDYLYENVGGVIGSLIRRIAANLK